MKHLINDTYIGFEPKICALCSNELKQEQSELILVGDENYTKKTFRCGNGHRVDSLYESGNDPKTSS